MTRPGGKTARARRAANPPTQLPLKTLRRLEKFLAENSSPYLVVSEPVYLLFREFARAGKSGG